MLANNKHSSLLWTSVNYDRIKSFNIVIRSWHSSNPGERWNFFNRNVSFCQNFRRKKKKIIAATRKKVFGNTISKKKILKLKINPFYWNLLKIERDFENSWKVKRFSSERDWKISHKKRKIYEVLQKYEDF